MGTIELLNGLADRSRREEVAAELARHWRAAAVFVLVPDDQLGVLRPAAGFRQTLPGGPTWRRFLTQCAHPGEHHAEVAFPNRDGRAKARGYVADNGAVLALVGGAPTLSYVEFKALPFALLCGLLRAENAEQAASGLVAAARAATERTTPLVAAPDRARSETQAKVGELQRVLREAAELSRQLHRLNDPLEERVKERTRELERQTEERLKAEAALLQAQKIEAVGQLTGGVAHDFNNLLSIIIGSLDLAQDLAGDNQRLVRAVEMAQRAAVRGARLTEQLLAFARRQMLRPRTIELNELIAEYQGLLRRAVGETVEIRTELNSNPCHCWIDPVQLETAILNLAINARDAMPGGGILSIETAPCDHDTEGLVDLAPGRYGRVTIRDNGTGMPADIVDRVFEPFFTTKPDGKGAGLGLSQVYGFVQQSDGGVAIDTELGRGTAIRIYLPLIAAEETRVEQVGSPRTRLSTGSETILVVEDDLEVAEIVLSMLQGAGYRTLAANSGADALSILDTDDDIDLLFTDLVMPGGISGIELARTARERRPGIKVLLASGYTAAPGVKDEATRDGIPFVLKPYRQHDLVAIIRTVLDGAAMDAPSAGSPVELRRAKA